MAEPFVLHINPSSATASSAGSSSFIRSLADQQFVLQIEQSSTPSHDQQTNPSTTPPPHGTLNLKVTEPILLHINSLTPLINPPRRSARHDQQEQSGKAFRHKTVLNRLGSLANLLPTGTVLAFEAITPSLTYRCQVFNKYLLACVMVVCSIICFLSSFTDSLEHEDKVYYGIATFKGLFVFNYDQDRENEEKMIEEELKTLNIKKEDLVHAFASVFVFLVFACSSSEVQSCYFPKSRQVVENTLVTYLPLVAGALSTLLFTIYPTRRKGIGYIGSKRA